ncbi:hypothetical protein [Xenorhabdus sp. BG5]|uniref:hypothetical protein n=1 Tax=Xenorhabdus sp. BG5 TaxID=2782014 RepID=UPI00187E43AC|nr:hypothetical protein [Xenorhabdus sp. BG5]MBE8598090.1 hypothetical protein [Xenorhabdus sp. BG5]
MSEKIKVEITAESRVYFAKYVEMDKADYEKYGQIIDSDLPNREIDRKIAELADKYNFGGYGNDIQHWDDLEEITFEALD